MTSVLNVVFKWLKWIFKVTVSKKFHTVISEVSSFVGIAVFYKTKRLKIYLAKTDQTNNKTTINVI